MEHLTVLKPSNFMLAHRFLAFSIVGCMCGRCLAHGHSVSSTEIQQSAPARMHQPHAFVTTTGTHLLQQRLSRETGLVACGELDDSTGACGPASGVGAVAADEIGKHLNDQQPDHISCEPTVGSASLEQPTADRTRSESFGEFPTKVLEEVRTSSDPPVDGLSEDSCEAVSHDQDERISFFGFPLATWQLLPASVFLLVAMVVLDGICLLTMKGSLSAVVM